MRYFSMFSGIGGFEIGIQRAGLLNYEYASIGTESEPQEFSPRGKWPSHQQGLLIHNRDRTTPLCVGYSEIDKYAIKVYERHFNGHTNYGDATAINPAKLPDFDLLVGGFPCQAFSIAGKRNGFNDTRGTLFFDIARILAEKRPRHLVLENVKGLLSHDGGKTFQTILGVLSDLGYRVEWQVLNSKDFGVPQNRERVYFIGHLRGECSGEVLPITGTNGKDTRIIGQDVAYAIDANYAKGTNTLEKSRRSVVRSAATRTRAYAGKPETLEIRKDELSNTINSVTKDYYATDIVRIRRLTPLECERLQGFPDKWTAEGRNKALCNSSCEKDHIHGIELISDSQRYKMCGNAVTVNTVEAVMTNLIKHIKEQIDE